MPQPQYFCVFMWHEHNASNPVSWHYESASFLLDKNKFPANFALIIFTCALKFAGALAMDVAGSMSSSSSHSSSGGGSGGSVQQSLATTCVGSTQQLRTLLNRVQHLHRPTVSFTQSAVSTLHYFMRCSQVRFRLLIRVPMLLR